MESDDVQILELYPDDDNTFIEELGTKFFMITIYPPSGEAFHMVTTEMVSVEELKKKMKKKTGLEVEDMRLMAGDKEMRDDMKIVDYGITSDAVLWLENRRGETGTGREKWMYNDEGAHFQGSSSIALAVNLPSGLFFHIATPETASVAELKREMKDETRIEVEDMRLMAGGKEMSDDMRIRDYGITSDAVLWLETEKEDAEGKGEEDVSSRDEDSSWELFSSLLFWIPVCVLAYCLGKQQGRCGK